MTKGITNIIFFTLTFLLIVNVTLSQNGIISISSVEGCEGDNLNIPVSAIDLTNIGAITLYIDYNPLSVEFDTMSYINPSLPGLIYNDITQVPGSIPGGKVGISWSGFNPVNISNDELFILSFTFLGENDSILFSNNNEIADFDANILQVSFVSGEISLSEEISISQQPEDLSIYSNDIGYFNVDGLNINEYMWEYNIDSNWIEIPEMIYFSGQNSSSLGIINPDFYLNERYFRCKLSGCNSIYSDSVQLFVQPDAISDIVTKESFNIYPVPSNDRINIEGTNIRSGYYTISLYNSLSGITNIINNRIYCNGSISTMVQLNNISSGMYSVILTHQSEEIEYKLDKIIIYK